MLLCADACALSITKYYSPRNAERPRRSSTRYIILHTTEGSKTGSLKKVHARGETHYFIDQGGKIYQIIHPDRVALHSGRSMWKGRTNVDTCSIGVEFVGYHNRDISRAQYRSGKDLIEMLQKRYGIADDCVLTHSMVAYGSPNRWHRRSHRGRKRCGMLFGRFSIRRRMGLLSQPMYDPDVKAGRLVDADPYLSRVLYGTAREQERVAAQLRATGGDVISSRRSAWDIARDRYDSADTVYVFPDGKRMRGCDVKHWKRMAAGTRVIMSGAHDDNVDRGLRRIGRDGKTARETAGDEYNNRTTLYFLPDGRVRSGSEIPAGELDSLPDDVTVLVGYINGGYVTGTRSAYDICGKQWDFPSTYYRFPDGKLLAGNRISERGIPKATMVFYRK